MPVHVFPVEDWIEHKTDGEPCPCEPTEEWIDPKSGLPYADGPVVVHQRLSGPNREASWDIFKGGE